MKGSIVGRLDAGGPVGLLSRLSFARVTTGVVAFTALFAAIQGILRIRSLKYLIALIIVGLVGAILLALKGKHEVLLFMLGLSLPLYMEVILARSSVNLTITGTFLIAALVALGGLVTGAIPWNRPWIYPSITVAGLLYLGAGFMSLMTTTERTGTLFAIIQEAEMIALFLILTNAIQQEKQLTAFLTGLYSSLAIECVLYVIQNITGMTFSVVGNASYSGTSDLESGVLLSQRGTLGSGRIITGMYFAVMTLSLIGAYACRKRPRVGINPLLGVAMGGICLVLSAKRSPWSGFAIGIILMIILFAFFSRDALSRMRRVAVIIALALTVLSPIIILRSHANHEADYEERENLTRIAWRMYDAHPLVGVGLGSYNSVKRQYLPEGFEGWVYTVHNRYLLILAETGIIGVTALAFVYLAVLHQATLGIRRVSGEHRPLQIGIVAGLVVMHWQMIWDIYDSRQANYIYWLFAALAVIIPRVLPNLREDVPDPASWQRS